MIPDDAHLSRSDSEAIARRRRGRNWAMLAILVLLCAIFYAVAWVKLTKS